ncbi:MAG TPA: FumA C-terminus/TtdB family hydratase beta subunit [Candidatus Cloacimonadota bacterium]|nr:FumA C-terminus/TtdB family hydratase beta subunit [Candidatus Cloacimonadota bacterium]HPS38456.1 FumA C-terminus/TtdB family hydratase beta subunit [Candidatus Cloacimonadota bacterium]
MRTHTIELPFTPEIISNLARGDKVILNGALFTARDAAHKRMLEYHERGEDLPLVLRETCIFYCGPSPTPPGRSCGAIGPTTSSRMDGASLILLKSGLLAMLGKGERSPEVENLIRKAGAVYLTCSGGVAALMSQYVVSCETFAWEDLGPEAIYRLVVKGFPAYVSIV